MPSTSVPPLPIATPMSASLRASTSLTPSPSIATISPRRYFCTQCHVSQHEVQPLVGNSFQTIDTLLQNEAKAPAKP